MGKKKLVGGRSYADLRALLRGVGHHTVLFSGHLMPTAAPRKEAAHRSPRQTIRANTQLDQWIGGSEQPSRRAAAGQYDAVALVRECAERGGSQR